MSNRPLVAIDDILIGALFDEVVQMFGADHTQGTIPRRHRGRAFDEIGEFPESVSICVDVFQAGAQVIGAFIVENSGPTATWSVRDRNQYLSELDAIFHILVHREIEALCELCLHRETSAPSHPEGATPTVTVSMAQIQVRTHLQN